MYLCHTFPWDMDAIDFFIAAALGLALTPVAHRFRWAVVRLAVLGARWAACAAAAAVLVGLVRDTRAYAVIKNGVGQRL